MLGIVRIDPSDSLADLLERREGKETSAGLDEFREAGLLGAHRPAETGTGSTMSQPPSRTRASTSAVGGDMARRKGCINWRGRSRNLRKLTCLDQRYVSPPNSMSLPLFSQLAIEVKYGPAATQPASHRSTRTGGRVFFH